ncbi:MAG TPA: DUF3575 domain-containing protein [Fibrobacteria bacterium]|nr:DUF3575 domain-containing protein [Fibrobacteria bacterium]HOX51363.1 DUF3575 domain-containing protein [Fibrobacteria bacterium]
MIRPSFVLAILLAPLVLHAQDPGPEPDPDLDDTAQELALVEDAPPPTPLVHTWIAMAPLGAILDVAPNLQVERMVGGSFSVAGSGSWAITSVNRSWSLSIRHHFQPALAGGFLGVFIRGFEVESDMGIKDKGDDRTFTFRQEGITAGIHGGYMKAYSSGFSMGWQLGLGWPWVHQEWVGATPTENERMIRNFSLAMSTIESGFRMGYAF